MPLSTVASQGYEENSYDQPPSKMKFNIGFNLPSMSISLPKLELPQISIKASVKNKKPFTLKLPVIKFNGYANSEEDNSYGSGGNDAGYAGGNNAPAYPGPTAYASGSGASGYVSALPENAYAGGQGGGGGGGYERPAAGPTYSSEGAQYGQNEPAYASSGYSAATQAPSSPYQSKPQALQQPHYQVNQPQPQQTHHQQPQPAYQIHNSPYQAAANVYNAPTQSTQVVNSSPYTGTSPTATANGYYVPRPVTNHQQQVPSYRDEPKSAPVQLYQAAGAGLYTAANPYETPEHAGPVASAYAPSNGGQLAGYSTFHRRSNRISNTHFPTFRSYETAAATLPEGRFVLAPLGDESTYKWQPILLRV